VRSVTTARAERDSKDTNGGQQDHAPCTRERPRRLERTPRLSLSLGDRSLERRRSERLATSNEHDTAGKPLGDRQVAGALQPCDADHLVAIPGKHGHMCVAAPPKRATNLGGTNAHARAGGDPYGGLAHPRRSDREPTIELHDDDGSLAGEGIERRDLDVGVLLDQARAGTPEGVREVGIGDAEAGCVGRNDGRKPAMRREGGLRSHGSARALQR
jgi:hypothetical protein